MLLPPDSCQTARPELPTGQRPPASPKWRGKWSSGTKILPKARLPMVPKIMPTMPPMPQSIPDSMRNWATMLLRCAPRLRRIPISRVRSVTVTSMMFMIPMPPTSRGDGGDAAQHQRDHGQLLVLIILPVAFLLHLIATHTLIHHAGKIAADLGDGGIHAGVILGLYQKFCGAVSPAAG